MMEDGQIESNIGEEKRRKKAEAFVTISERRVTAALNQIALIGNLANKSSYIYTEEQVKEILGVLKAEIDALEKKFMHSNEKSKKNFSFGRN